MRTSIRGKFVLAVLAVVLAGAGSAMAATYTNNGANGAVNWTTSADWAPAGYPNATGDVAYIYNDSSQSFTLGGNITLGTLRIRKTNYNWSKWFGAGASDSFTFAAVGGPAAIYEVDNFHAYLDGIYCPITLNSDLTVNNPQWSIDNIYALPKNGTLGFALYGKISGNGNLTKTGVGALILTNAANDFVGAVTVAEGYLVAKNDAESILGNAANLLTIGSPGRCGEVIFGNNWYDRNFLLTRPVYLQGVGGRMTAYAKGLAISNSIAGPGQLILAPGNARWLHMYGTNDNTYSGGTRVWADQRTWSTKRVFGTGNLTAQYFGMLYLNDSNNISPTATVRVDSVRTPATPCGGYPAQVYLASDMTVNIDSNSSGVLLFNETTTTSGAKINAMLATNATQLGNGLMAYGSREGGDMPGQNCYFTGSSLQPNRDGVYRFNYFNNASVFLNNSAGNTGVLVGTNGVEVVGFIPYGPYPMSGQLNLQNDDKHSFSGPITCWSGAGVVGNSYLAGAAQGSGSTNGDVVLHAGWFYLYNGVGGPSQNITQKRNLTFDSLVWTGTRSDNDNVTNTLQFASVTRTNRAILAIEGAANIGGSWKYCQWLQCRLIIDSGVPASVNGMVPPYFAQNWRSGYAPSAPDMTFMNYVPGQGFTAAAFTKAGLTGATATDIVYAAEAAIESVPGGGIEVYALRAKYALTTNAASPGDPIKIGSGGVLLQQADSTVNTAPLDFGNTEGIIRVGNGTSIYLDGRICGSNGVTLSLSSFRASGNGGSGRDIYLRADNTTNLFGQVTINHGVIRASNAKAFGNSNNVICINGPGVSGLNGAEVCELECSDTIWNPIYLGPVGGAFAGRTLKLNGKISGTGQLTIGDNAAVEINNAANDYSGGTMVFNSDITTVGVNARLGTGPVILAPYNAYAHLFLAGTNNVDPSAKVSMIEKFGKYVDNNNGDMISLGASAHTFGSLEGFGYIRFDYNAPITFSVGQNGDSTEFFGYFVNDNTRGANNWPDRFIKTGSGTMTFWAENVLRGGICTNTVAGGTLLLNGMMTGTVEVASSATLGGNGLVGGKLNVLAGGKLRPGYQGKGALTVCGNATFDPVAAYEITVTGTNAGVDFAQLNVAGTLSLGNVPLTLTLTQAPVVGQSFTLMDNAPGAIVSGTFASGRSVAATFNGRTYSFGVSYSAGASGNDIVLTSMPRGTVIMIK